MARVSALPVPFLRPRDGVHGKLVEMCDEYNPFFALPVRTDFVTAGWIFHGKSVEK